MRGWILGALLLTILGSGAAWLLTGDPADLTAAGGGGFAGETLLGDPQSGAAAGLGQGQPTLEAPPSPPSAGEDKRDPNWPRLVAQLRGRKRAPPTRAESVAVARQRLGAARSWKPSLAAFDRLPGVEDPSRATAHADAVRDASDDPVVDQNLIFHVALTVPRAPALVWLRGIEASEDPADREDALVARAFLGEPEAAERFVALAHVPSSAPVHRLLDTVGEFESFAASGGPQVREILRSYRAVEVLDHAPYFKRTIFEVSFTWQPPPQLPSDTRRRLLEAWLARYPGHPGSDDMALRLAEIAAAGGDFLEAARWYSRASTLPDQDVAFVAAERLVATAEMLLSPAQISRLLSDREVGGLNRDLLLYVRTRRVAAETGLAGGLAEAESIARGEPRSRMAEAWRRRLAMAPPAGLDSGLRSVPLDDPLRRVLPAEPLAPLDADVEAKQPLSWVSGWGRYIPGQQGEGRLQPHPDAILLDVPGVASQLRAWEAIAELERRAAFHRGEARADLLYQAAAVWFHKSDALFPAYGLETENFTAVLRSLAYRGADEAAYRRAHAAFEERSFSWLRALALFERIEQEVPDYPAMDRVVFSQALAWKRLVDYRPYISGSSAVGWEASEVRRRNAMRRAVAALERCRRRFPDSPLADDASRAVSWWQRARPLSSEPEEPLPLPER